MAKIFPFRAFRYNPARVRLADVVTQPYDKITPEMQERYYAASPYNMVRIILGKREPGDNDSQNVYSRAAAAFAEWRKAGILQQDQGPAIYAYSQEFTVPGADNRRAQRMGFIALGQLEPYEAGVVFRHEQTHSAPKTDRLNLLRATRTHFGQLFMLYNDPAGAIDEALTKAACCEPAVEVRDEYEVVHRLWSVPGLTEFICHNMDTKKLIIADGHHRYETALNYQRERRSQAQEVPLGEAPHDRVMMTFINMNSDDLVILPTHRVISGLAGFSEPQLMEAVKASFEVQPAEFATGPQATDLLAKSGKLGAAFLAITSKGASLLRARSAAVARALSGLSQHQRELDVVVLHRLVLERGLGLSEEAIREQRNIAYLRDADEAMARVRQGANVAFLMNPVRIEQVRDTAFAGEVLPQKSTDFYPKLLSGLTIYALE